MDCYRFELREYKHGCLDKSVDATYVIHLEGNGRLPNIETQLKKYPLTKTNYILFNKGFSTCKKHKDINMPALDLIDAFKTVFQDAHEKKYENILVFEDDFFYNEDINDSIVQSEINTFMLNQKNQECLYYLGCIPFLQIPSLSNHRQVLVSIGMHACIYSKPLRDRILQNPKLLLITQDWDMFSNFLTRYMYYKPLCYQLFPNTQNSNETKKYGFGLGYIVYYLFKELNLDKQVDPGYDYFYLTSWIQFYIYLFLIMYAILNYMEVYKT